MALSGLLFVRITAIKCHHASRPGPGTTPLILIGSMPHKGGSGLGHSTDRDRIGRGEKSSIRNSRGWDFECTVTGVGFKIYGTETLPSVLWLELPPFSP
jgi:hypothetical protein